jgi:hypothetical protein
MPDAKRPAYDYDSSGRLAEIPRHQLVSPLRVSQRFAHETFMTPERVTIAGTSNPYRALSLTSWATALSAVAGQYNQWLYNQYGLIELTARVARSGAVRPTSRSNSRLYVHEGVSHPQLRVTKSLTTTVCCRYISSRFRVGAHPLRTLGGKGCDDQTKDLARTVCTAIPERCRLWPLRSSTPIP